MAILVVAACGGGTGEPDPAAEQLYLGSFCAALDSWSEALRPYDEDGPAILAHLPESTADLLAVLEGLDVPPTLEPFHQFYVDFYGAAARQDLVGVTVSSAEEAYRQFFQEPARRVGDRWDAIAESRQRIAELAPDVPGCGEVFAAGMGFTAPTRDE